MYPPLREVVLEYGEDVKWHDFIPIAAWIAHAWDPCEDLRAAALKNLCAKHSDNVSNLQQQGKFDQSAEIELWNPCVTFSYPPDEDAIVERIKQDASERDTRNLQVRDANTFEWRIWYGFGKGPWQISRKATPEDLATQSRWVQLGWPIHRSHGVLCPKNCFCAICMKNYGLNDPRVAILRRRSNPGMTSEELGATVSALKDLRRYCDDTYRNLERRLNMENGTRIEIQNRLRAEQGWINSDRVRLFAGRHEIETRKNELVSFIEHICIPPTHEVDLDELDAAHRSALRHCFDCLAPVIVTDPSTGKVVTGRIDHTIRSTRLGPGIDPDWVFIKGTWYRDKEVGVERTKEIDDYQSSDLELDCGGGSLTDLTDCEISGFEIKHEELTSHGPNASLTAAAAPTASLFTGGNVHELQDELSFEAHQEEVGLNNEIQNCHVGVRRHCDYDASESESSC